MKKSSVLSKLSPSPSPPPQSPHTHTHHTPHTTHHTPLTSNERGSSPAVRGADVAFLRSLAPGLSSTASSCGGPQGLVSGQGSTAPRGAQSGVGPQNLEGSTARRGIHVRQGPQGLILYYSGDEEEDEEEDEQDEDLDEMDVTQSRFPAGIQATRMCWWFPSWSCSLTGRVNCTPPGEAQITALAQQPASVSLAGYFWDMPSWIFFAHSASGSTVDTRLRQSLDLNFTHFPRAGGLRALTVACGMQLEQRRSCRLRCDHIASDSHLMGGLVLDEKSAVLGLDSLPVPRLFSSGEVSRGVHGHIRLGENSLLDCVGFGRVARPCAVHSTVKVVRTTGRCHFRAAGRFADVLAVKMVLLLESVNFVGQQLERWHGSSSSCTVALPHEGDSRFGARVVGRNEGFHARE